MNHLREIFPMHSDDILKRAMNTSENHEDRVQNVLDKSKEVVNEIHKSNITIKGRFYKSKVFSGQRYIMKVYCSEIGRIVLRFYKKAVQKTDALKIIEISLSQFLDVISVEKNTQEKN